MRPSDVEASKPELCGGALRLDEFG